MSTQQSDALQEAQGRRLAQMDEAFPSEQGRRLTHAPFHHCNQDYGGAATRPSADFGAGLQRAGASAGASAMPARPKPWGELSVWGDSIAFELAGRDLSSATPSA